MAVAGAGRPFFQIAVVVLLAASWLMIGPEQLGGPATYVVTSGVSMQPLLRAGDLALVRRQASYRVGEVVLYESRVLRHPVLHRIVAIRGGRYYFRGDNNDFVDPGYATRSELVGRLWFAVPALGGILRFLAQPVQAALAAGLLTFLAASFAMGGGFARRRRRIRRHRPALFFEGRS